MKFISYSYLGMRWSILTLSMLCLWQRVVGLVTSTNNSINIKAYEGDSVHLNMADMFTFTGQTTDLSCRVAQGSIGSLSNWQTPISFQKQDSILAGVEFIISPLVSNQTIYTILKTEANEIG